MFFLQVDLFRILVVVNGSGFVPDISSCFRLVHVDLRVAFAVRYTSGGDGRMLKRGEIGGDCLSIIILTRSSRNSAMKTIRCWVVLRRVR